MNTLHDAITTAALVVEVQLNELTKLQETNPQYDGVLNSSVLALRFAANALQHTQAELEESTRD